MKKLIVCGDSFMSPVVSYPGTHFSQIFARELGFDLDVYARAGMSNAGIMIQLNSAIIQEPDLIFFSTTSFDRTEVPVKTLTKYDTDTYYKEDLLYTQSLGLSSLYPYNNIDPKIWSISIKDLLHHTRYDSRNSYFQNHNTMVNLDRIEDYEKKCEVAKDWFMYLYDPIVKRMVDSFMLYGIIHKVHCSGIPYIWIHDGIHPDSLIKPTWLEDKNDLRVIIGHMIHNSYKLLNNNDPGYHTPIDTQKEIANEVIGHYKKYFIK